MMYTPSSKSGDAEPESPIRPAVSAGASGLIPSSEQRRFRRRCYSTQGAAFPQSRTSVKAFFVHSGRRIRLEADPGGGAAPIRLYLGRSGFPFRSREYTNPDSVAYSKVEVPDALWHESHTFTCFAYPTFSEEDVEQIAGSSRLMQRRNAMSGRIARE